MKLYLRKSDRFFPVYEPEVKKHGSAKYVVVKGIEEDYDPKTQRLGNWTQPDIAEGDEILEDGKPVGNKPGVMTSYRRAVPRTPEEIAEITREDWEDVRNPRDALLIETDRMMFEDYPISTQDRKDLLVYRQELRDITDDKKNGGIKDPKKIKVRRFKDA